MLALYLGYVIVQGYNVIDVFFKNTLAPSAALFSIIVFIIWSFIPVSGYLLAKLFGAKSTLSQPLLFTFGISVALFENSWFYLDWFVKGEDFIATAIVFMLFFGIAFFPLRKKQ